ncbi:NAD(P)-dependent dehydrogenase (short-subunit alcohol dehydrogenase family) [Deinobacterium chartae]|uniref:NAD(P)-dependent dehydrogenase (Short-subunit alcohol dehydrogenase family) n=1 Tax=Deinobacterium chartae TaxID=521158 RepID=A0A841HYT6_9DEIO|nr:SDR family oxidoreductase [Deinobacterium chartae]MBB6096935.1 NAD(P)-dependent dehydrogenase (short-subunit alcohol dehydrogenase family) [Deinobacterium chartae]
MSNLHGKVVLVTGGTGGIGKVTARELARQGARVTIIGRDPHKTATVLEELRQSSGDGHLEGLVGDLSRMSEVRRMAELFTQRHARLDVLINNAGALFGQREVSAEGHEMTWALNHLAPFLLTHLLRDLLTSTPGARVVNVSSEAHRLGRVRFDDLEGQRHYSAWRAYNQSKLANLLFTRELSRRLLPQGVTVNALHPGLVNSGFGKGAGGDPLMRLLAPFSITPEQGALSSVYLASSADVARVSGRYFVRERPVRPAPQAQDDRAARRLWQISARMVGLEASGDA